MKTQYILQNNECLVEKSQTTDKIWNEIFGILKVSSIEEALKKIKRELRKQECLKEEILRLKFKLQ